MLMFRFAHEVYVLSPSRVSGDKQQHVNFFAPLHSAHDRTIIIAYMLGALIGLGIAIWLKTQKPLRQLGAFIDRAGFFAPDLIRVVFGLSLIFSARHNAMFGPELPLSGFPHGHIIRWCLFILGTGIVLGLFTRILSLLSIVLFAYAMGVKGWYMLTYTNYLGEALALILVAYQRFSLDRIINRIKPYTHALTRPDLALPATRILFGFALFFTALNIKVFNAGVSVDVVNQYHLTKYFHYDPALVVFGAALVEIAIATLYMIGLLQRVNSIIFVSFITLSLIYFKEQVWPHYLLFALAIGIFLDKPDRYALDGRIGKSKKS